VEPDDGLVVTVSTDTCMGSGNCAFWAPGTFELADDADHSVVVSVPSDPLEKILAAARGCPTQSIRVHVAGDRIH
jgi:ferredoxin